MDTNEHVERQCHASNTLSLYDVRRQSGLVIFILRDVILVIEKRTEEFDGRLGLPLDFVSKILNVTNSDFVSLAISNLLDEELDWIDNKGFDADSQEVKSHRKIVKEVKFEADNWVINRK